MRVKFLINALILFSLFTSVSTIALAQNGQSNGFYGPVDLNRHVGVGDLNRVHYERNNGPVYTDNGLRQQDINRTHIGVGEVNGEADVKREDENRETTTTTRIRTVRLPITKRLE